MSSTAARERVAAASVGRLATVTTEGKPHIVPCCFAVIEDRIYSVVDGKPKSSMALKRLDNVAANPSTALLVDHYADDWTELWWVRADGAASVVESSAERATALADLTAKYDQYRLDPPLGAMLRIDVTAWTGWSFSAS